MNMTPKKAAQILLADLYLAITNFDCHFPEMGTLHPRKVLEIGFVAGDACAMLREENHNTELLYERIHFLFELLAGLGGDALIHASYLTDFILLIGAAKQGKYMPQGISSASLNIISRKDDQLHFPSKAVTIEANLAEADSVPEAAKKSKMLH